MQQINKSLKRDNRWQQKGMMSKHRSIELVVNSVVLNLHYHYSKLDKKCSPAEYCTLMKISRHCFSKGKKGMDQFHDDYVLMDYVSYLI